MTHIHRCFSALACLLVVGCADRIALDSSTLCLSELPPGDSIDVAQIEAGQPLQLFVTGTGGCHMADIEVSCNATVEGDTIVVSSEMTWRRTEPLAMSCEMALSVVTASCETDVPLEDGTYTIVYADLEQDIDVPSSADAYECLSPEA